jgi:hypothetical protein
MKKNGYQKYLEIGVNTPKQPGWNFNNINATIKHGVDPNVDTTYKVPSDVFFKKHVTMKYDLVFIDGLHIFEQAYRDITNSLKWLNKGGAIVVHDCNPTTEITQRRIRASNVWHGDVWKAILKLRVTNPHVVIYTVDTDEGCAVIQKGRQKLLKTGKGHIYNFKFLDAHRQDVLNLISVGEFRKKMGLTRLAGFLTQMETVKIDFICAVRNQIHARF